MAAMLAHYVSSDDEDSDWSPEPAPAVDAGVDATAPPATTPATSAAWGAQPAMWVAPPASSICEDMDLSSGDEDTENAQFPAALQVPLRGRVQPPPASTASGALGAPSAVGAARAPLASRSVHSASLNAQGSAPGGSETVPVVLSHYASNATVCSNVTVLDWHVDDWLEGKAGPTREYYLRAFRSLMTFLRPVGPEFVTMADVQRWRTHVLATVPARSASNYIYPIKSLFKYLHACRAIDWNPTQLLRAPPRPPMAGAKRFLTRVHVQTILGACRRKTRAMFSIMYYSGARVKELGLLQRANVTDAGSRVTLHIHGKGNRLRDVRLGQAGTDIVRDWLQRGAGDVFLFPGPSGEKGLTPNSMRRRLRTVLKYLEPAEDMPDWTVVSPHWLRHAFATHAHAAGADVVALGKILGHADTRTTLRYIHADPDVASKLDD